MAQQQYKRRKFPVIHRGYQFHFALRGLAYGSLLFAFLLFVFLKPDVDAANGANGVSSSVQAFAQNRIDNDHPLIWLGVLGLMIASALASFRSILKIVGPAYRLRWAMDKVIDDDLDFKVTLRDGDLLYDEANKFNELIDHWSDRVAGLQLELAKLDEAVQTCRVEIAEIENPALAEKLGEIDVITRELRDDFLRVRVKSASGAEESKAD